MTADAHQVMNGLVTEDQLLTTVMEMAAAYGYLAYHPRPARTQKGWRTLTQGDPGWPDVVLCRPAMHYPSNIMDGPLGDLLILELKTELGQPTTGQRMWLGALQDAGVEARVLRPSDLEWLKERLSR